MATNKNIYSLGSLIKTSVNDYDFLETANSITGVARKLQVSSLFASLATTCLLYTSDAADE